MTGAMKALAVVPAFQEEDTIARTAASLVALETVERVIVVDDASRDLTARRAVEAGADVVVNGRNMGKGGSLNRVLSHLEFDVLLLVDGDLGDCASWAADILRPVVSGEADMAIASFGPASRKGGLGLAKGLGGAGIKLLTGRKMVTPLSGQRAMTAELFDAVTPFASGFGMEVAMTIDALRAGFRVAEVPTGMTHRETGRDAAGFLHRGRQFADILVALLNRAAGYG